jgi:hypothetical protein
MSTDRKDDGWPTEADRQLRLSKGVASKRLGAISVSMSSRPVRVRRKIGSGLLLG